MIKYKRKLNEDYSIEEEREKCKGYSFGLFSSYLDKKDIWCSFDRDSKNFHIVPQGDIRLEIDGYNGTVYDYRQYILYNIMNEFEKRGIQKKKRDAKDTNEIENTYCKSQGRPQWTKNQQWISVIKGKYEYLLVLGRLWCNNNVVNNAFDKIQFMRYPIADKQINLVNGKFQMMYPTSNADGAYNFDKNSDHLTYNPMGLTIMSDVEAIANQFIDFINISTMFK